MPNVSALDIHLKGHVLNGVVELTAFNLVNRNQTIMDYTVAYVTAIC